MTWLLTVSRMLRILGTMKTFKSLLKFTAVLAFLLLVACGVGYLGFTWYGPVSFQTLDTYHQCSIAVIFAGPLVVATGFGLLERALLPEPITEDYPE